MGVFCTFALVPKRKHPRDKGKLALGHRTPSAAVSTLEDELQSGAKSIVKIVKHSFVFLVVLGLGILLHATLIWVGDPKIFDLIPWRYASDGADLTITFKLVLMIWKELGDQEKIR